MQYDIQYSTVLYEFKFIKYKYSLD
jgi:hypothetical protein